MEQIFRAVLMFQMALLGAVILNKNQDPKSMKVHLMVLAICCIVGILFIGNDALPYFIGVTVSLLTAFIARNLPEGDKKRNDLKRICVLWPCCMVLVFVAVVVKGRVGVVVKPEVVNIMRCENKGSEEAEDLKMIRASCDVFYGSGVCDKSRIVEDGSLYSVEMPSGSNVTFRVMKRDQKKVVIIESK